MADLLDRDVTLQSGILEDFGHRLSPNSVLLDFGCGAGDLVHAYRAKGIDAYGADVHLDEPGPNLFEIPLPEYRLPFPDGTFDVVVSNSVLEHVADLGGAFHEINRVLKPGGGALHLFPPPASPIEPHVHVPLGGLVQARWWLAIWALLGVRNDFQRNIGWREVAAQNRLYLQTKTFYRSKREIRAALQPRFHRITFANRAMLRHSYGSARYLAPIGAVVGELYGACRTRCLFFEKPA